MSTDKQNNEDELAMAILNGLSGPNACKGADERRRMIPLHIADQAVAACEKEIAALKAEVERLRQAEDALGDSIEIYRLKAEVDLWKLRSDNWQKLVQFTMAEVERLRASSFVTAVPVEQYERVLKAGDAMAADLPPFGSVKDWNAAKEGKPSV